MSCRLSPVLRLFCFVLFRFSLFAFIGAAALRSIVLRFSICMHPDSQTQLPNNSTVYVLYFVCVSSFFFLLWRCRFFQLFLYRYRLSLYGEHVVLFPLLYTSLLCENSIIQPINQSKTHRHGNRFTHKTYLYRHILSTNCSQILLQLYVPVLYIICTYLTRPRPASHRVGNKIPR